MNNSQPILNILISTIDSRIINLKNFILPPREDVNYIVSHQFTEEKFKIIPPEIIRNDVIINQIPGKGISRSRNFALKLSNGQIGLLSDDDVKYSYEYFDLIISQFTSDLSLDVACFKIKTPEGFPPYKEYDDHQKKINNKNLNNISSIEVAFNIKKIQNLNIKFDERFGLGQPVFIGGEENIFISDCLKKGLNVCYFPKYIVEHPYESTSKKLNRFEKKKICLDGAYDARINGIISILRAFYLSFRFLPILIKNKKNVFSFLYFRLYSSIYILSTNKKHLLND